MVIQLTRRLEPRRDAAPLIHADHALRLGRRGWLERNVVDRSVDGVVDLDRHRTRTLDEFDGLKQERVDEVRRVRPGGTDRNRVTVDERLRLVRKRAANLRRLLRAGRSAVARVTVAGGIRRGENARRFIEHFRYLVGALVIEHRRANRVDGGGRRIQWATPAALVETAPMVFNELNDASVRMTLSVVVSPMKAATESLR